MRLVEIAGNCIASVDIYSAHRFVSFVDFSTPTVDICIAVAYKYDILLNTGYKTLRISLSVHATVHWQDLSSVYSWDRLGHYSRLQYSYLQQHYEPMASNSLNHHHRSPTCLKREKPLSRCKKPCGWHPHHCDTQKSTGPYPWW